MCGSMEIAWVVLMRSMLLHPPLFGRESRTSRYKPAVAPGEGAYGTRQKHPVQVRGVPVVIQTLVFRGVAAPRDMPHARCSPSIRAGGSHPPCGNDCGKTLYRRLRAPVMHRRRVTARWGGCVQTSIMEHAIQTDRLQWCKSIVFHHLPAGATKKS